MVPIVLLAFLFVAISCSLPLLMMMHAPPVAPSRIATSRLRQVRSIDQRADELLPERRSVHSSVSPLPPPQLAPSTRAASLTTVTTSEIWTQAGRQRAAAGVGHHGAVSRRSLAEPVASSTTESAEMLLARMSDPPAMDEIIVYLDAFIRRLHQKFMELKK